MSNEKNHIEQAYEEGKRIQHFTWGSCWIKKHSDNLAETEKGELRNRTSWAFDENATHWRVLPDDVETDIPKNKVEHNRYGVKVEVSNFETPTQPDAIQQAIDLLKSNGYEVYRIEKIKV
jgi:G3E family GTPase